MWRTTLLGVAPQQGVFSQQGLQVDDASLPAVAGDPAVVISQDNLEDNTAGKDPRLVQDLEPVPATMATRKRTHNPVQQQPRFTDIRYRGKTLGNNNNIKIAISSNISNVKVPEEQQHPVTCSPPRPPPPCPPPPDPPCNTTQPTAPHHHQQVPEEDLKGQRPCLE